MPTAKALRNSSSPTSRRSVKVSRRTLPRNCLPGSGWQPISSETGRVDVPVPGGSIHINQFVVSKGEEQSVVYYWYQSQSRVIADEFAAKFYLVSDSIRHHRSDHRACQGGGFRSQ